MLNDQVVNLLNLLAY